MGSGGEALTENLVAQYHKILNLPLLNSYGPAECTITATASDIKSNDPISIGKPISNLQVYILDANDNPVPIGVSGELCISGVGVARGYLNKPDLTEQKFVPNPFTRGNDINSERLYRTGDLVRYLPDGNIEYLGRIDHQVKIRGYRIELGEIENALEQHDDVQQAIVVAKEDIHNISAKRLVAYITLQNDKQLLANELHAYLGKLLPSHMVPAQFIFLMTFPLNTSGKVDRNALPEPDHQVVTKSYVAPRNQWSAC